jgi:CheY-like chemotaxis protein
MRVLIVDDEALIASSLKVFLDDEGIEALSAGSGEEALEILKISGRFDVCVMDMRLPGMDGNDAIRKISADYPEIRFIVHTGSVNYSVPADLKPLGIQACHLFNKPLSDMTPIADEIRKLGMM